VSWLVFVIVLVAGGYIVEIGPGAAMPAGAGSDDELARYRPAIEAVTVEDLTAAARAHIQPAAAAIVLVGDADAFLPALEAAAVGPIVVDREAVLEVPADAAAAGADGPA